MIPCAMGQWRAWVLQPRPSAAKSRTWLSDFTFTFHFYALEKEMATHSSLLAWRIPGMGSHRVGHDWSDLVVAVAKRKRKSSLVASVQFSRSIVSDSLRPHESWHARPLCLSPTSGVYSNSCPSSRWCHAAISSSVIPFSSCPQSLTASGSFPVSQLFTWGGQSTGVSASASVLPMNTQDWSPLGWTGWISCSPRDSQESSPAPQFKSINFSALSFLHSPTLTSIRDHWKNHSLD